MNKVKIKNLLEDITIEIEKSLPRSKNNSDSFYGALSDLFVDYFDPEYERLGNKDFSSNLWLNCKKLQESLRKEDFYKSFEILVNIEILIQNIKWKVQDLKIATVRLSDSCFNKSYRLNKDYIEKTKIELVKLMEKILNERNITKKKTVAEEYRLKYRSNELLSYSGKKEDEVFFFVYCYSGDLTLNKKRENDKALAKELDKEIKKALKKIVRLKIVRPVEL